MMSRLHRALARRRAGLAAQEAEGFAMILVIAFTMLILGLLIVASTVAVNSLGSSKSHGTFEQALAVAEMGVDQTLARLQVDTAYNPCGCAIPGSALASDAAERAWAKAQLLSFASNAANLQTTSQGQFAAIRPTNGQKVYAMSWVPSKASASAKSRMIKADYLFSPYKPGNAFSAQGDVDFAGGSVDIVPIAGSPAGLTTPVHTNGNMTGSASSINIQGPATTSGTYGLPGGANVGPGSGGNAPLESVPNVSPLAVYRDTASAAYASSWYDLCPDGKVRMKAALNPCTGTIVAERPLTDVYPGFRGWRYSKTGSLVTWYMDFPNSPYAGVYYVYQGNADLTGNITGGGTPWNATVLAEALPGGAVGNLLTCEKLGGDIATHNTDITAFYPGLVLEAGADLNISASSNLMQLGLFAAADQVYLTSSSAATIRGAVVAKDSCVNSSSPSSMQGIRLEFDSTFESPVQSVIRTTQWIEYVGT